MRGATFSTMGRKISSHPNEPISHLDEIEFPGGGNISAGGRLNKWAISFRVTGPDLIIGPGPPESRPSFLL